MSNRPKEISMALLRAILLGVALCLVAATLEALGILTYFRARGVPENKRLTGLLTPFPYYAALGAGLGLGCGLFRMLVSRLRRFSRLGPTRLRALERGLLVSSIIFVYLGVIVHSRIFGNIKIHHPLSLLISAGLIAVSLCLAFSLEALAAFLGRRRRLKAAVTSALALVLLVWLGWGGLFYRQNHWSSKDFVEESFGRAKLAAEGSASRPNILLITVDTLRADHLSAYGYKGIRTENIDRLAAEGVLFEQMIAQSSWTKPSFGSMWTSLYPSQHQANAKKMYVDQDELVTVFSHGLRGDVATLAQTLSRGGYMTVGFNTNPQLIPENGFDRGFQWYVDDTGRTGMRRRSVFPYSIFWPISRKFHLPEARLFRYRGVPYSNAQEVLGNVEKVLDRLPAQGRPYFFWVHFMDAHLPYYSHEEGLVERSTLQFGGLKETSGIIRESEDIPGLKERMKAAYDGEILYVDRHIGKLLKSFAKRGLLSNTMVVLTSDHGEELLDHWKKSFAKEERPILYHRGYDHGHTMYDELLRIPLIIRFPDKRYAGRRVEPIVQHIDLFPTLAAYAGIGPKGVPGGLEGVNLLKHLEDDKPLSRRYARSESNFFGPEIKQIRSTDYKLIYRTNGQITEFYHLSSDPGERRNIAAGRGETYAEMLSAFNRWTARMRLETPSRHAAAADKEELIPEGLDEQAREELKEQLKALGYIQ